MKAPKGFASWIDFFLYVRRNPSYEEWDNFTTITYVDKREGEEVFQGRLGQIKANVFDEISHWAFDGDALLKLYLSTVKDSRGMNPPEWLEDVHHTMATIKYYV